MPFSEYADLFRAESREHIASINHLLLALEADPGASEPLEGVFRAVHTIKGMAASMGYAGLADLSHEMESVLDLLRRGRARVDAGLIELLFAATDALEAGVSGVEAGEAGADRLPEAEPLIERLQAAAERLGAGVSGDEAQVAAAALRVRLRVAATSPLPSVRAFMAVQRARQFGEVSELAPPEAEIKAEGFGGGVQFLVRTALDADEVHARLGALGELDALSVEMVDGVPTAPAVPSNAAFGVPATDLAAGRALVAERSVRVDAERLDSVLDRIGELVILRDRLLRVAAAQRSAELTELAEQMARLIGELREEVMGMRMTPVAHVFDRFPRLVRDAATALGKRVELVVEGRDIELDRSLLERLGDPLVHLLRNAVDHGVERPDDRRASGKPELARLRLSASRERDRVLVRVSDDGRGIDRERVIRQAVRQGLIGATEAAELPDEDVYQLITRPGFSTAERVTDVSGRGVGLDVVTTRVRELGGVLEIASRPGAGTTFTLRLPVTVGILRALLVRAGESTYALPVAHVAETVEFTRREIHAAAGRRAGVLRGEPLPLRSLRELLAVEAPEPVGELVPVVLLELEEQFVGLEVDALLGQQEIVIKEFDGTVDTLPVFSGATILPDGRPALILDVAGLFQQTRQPGLAVA